MDDLPPDLSRLGGQLTSAIDNSLRRRRVFRALVRRIVTAGGVGALLFVSITAAPLHPDVARVAPVLALQALPFPAEKSHKVELRCGQPQHGARGSGCVAVTQPMAAWEPEQRTG